MVRDRYPSSIDLTFAAIINFVIAVLHIVVPFNGMIDYIYIGTNKFALLEMQRSPLPESTNLLLALVFAVFGMYCLSGAEMMRPLPGLNPVLWFIGGLFTLRGLIIIPRLLGFGTNEQLPAVHFSISILALVIGLLILIGMKKKKQEYNAVE